MDRKISLQRTTENLSNQVKTTSLFLFTKIMIKANAAVSTLSSLSY